MKQHILCQAFQHFHAAGITEFNNRNVVTAVFFFFPFYSSTQRDNEKWHIFAAYFKQQKYATDRVETKSAAEIAADLVSTLSVVWNNIINF